MVWLERLVERVRTLFLSDLAERVGILQSDVQQLRRQVEQQQEALNDPATFESVVTAALREHARCAPDELADVLAPLVQRLVRVSAAPPQSPPPSSRGWVVGAMAVLLITLIIPRITATSEATVEVVPAAQAAQAAPVSVPAAPKVVILEERHEGFGLGEAVVSDGDLAREVRRRLAACPELQDAQVSFAVNDGWVWLRGEASDEGRKAAEQALRDVQPGVFVVDQLAVTSSEPANAIR